jgi:hypothetical protein
MRIVGESWNRQFLPLRTQTHNTAGNSLSHRVRSSPFAPTSTCLCTYVDTIRHSHDTVLYCTVLDRVPAWARRTMSLSILPMYVRVCNYIFCSSISGKKDIRLKKYTEKEIPGGIPHKHATALNNITLEKQTRLSSHKSHTHTLSLSLRDSLDIPAPKEGGRDIYSVTSTTS